MLFSGAVCVFVLPTVCAAPSVCIISHPVIFWKLGKSVGRCQMVGCDCSQTDSYTFVLWPSEETKVSATLVLWDAHFISSLYSSSFSIFPIFKNNLDPILVLNQVLLHPPKYKCHSLLHTCTVLADEDVNRENQNARNPFVQMGCECFNGVSSLIASTSNTNLPRK